jgi:phosphoribosylformimino-5-aminoimidazole carboxamide ribotide isomerase
MTRFRPCIDLHEGQVKQIVGGSLSDDRALLRTNFVSEHQADYFSGIYRADQLPGGHIIKLGPGNDAAATAALAAWPGGLQIGGGIDDTQAPRWLDAGADKVIITSWLFPGGAFAPDRLASLAAKIGPRRLVVDLSCRRQDGKWLVAMDRWQTMTAFVIDQANLALLSQHCSEFLIHAADVEGLCAGIDEELVAALGQWSPLPCTYAGGAKSIADLTLVERLSNGRVDLTFGSSLDLFGGNLVRYEDCVRWNRSHP